MGAPVPTGGPPAPARLPPAFVLGIGALGGAGAVVWLKAGSGPASGIVALMITVVAVALALRLPVWGQHHVSDGVRRALLLLLLSFLVQTAEPFLEWALGTPLPEGIDNAVAFASLGLPIAALRLLRNE